MIVVSAPVEIVEMESETYLLVGVYGELRGKAVFSIITRRGLMVSGIGDGR